MSNFAAISSRDNDLIKHIIQLQKSSKARKEKGQFVLEGLRLCLDAAQNGFAPEKLIVSKTAEEKYSDDILTLASDSASCFVVPDSLFEKISDTVSPQGIMCVCRVPQFKSDLFDKNGRYIALENLQDPSNLGAISRTAEALGISGIVMQGGCDPYSSKSLRASMGALLRIPVIKLENMFEFFSKKNITTVGAVINNAQTKAGEFSFCDGCAIIIGNEANGLTKQTIDSCAHTITIPMRGKAESLNAAVAASILMWEMIK